MASFGSCDPAPWRDLPAAFGPLHPLLQPFRPRTTGWRLGLIVDALAAAHDAAVRMIDTSIACAHQQGARIAI